MELAIATSFDHNKLHQNSDHPRVLATYQNLAYIAKSLKHYLKLKTGKKYLKTQPC
jgi:hypothetical protein